MVPSILKLVYQLPSLAIYSAYAALAACFRKRATTRSWSHDFRNRRLHAMMSIFDVEQLPSVSKVLVQTWLSENKCFPGSSRIGANIPPLPTNRQLFPRTSDTMLAYCKKHELPLQTELIPEGMGAKIHWLGDRSLQKCKVILYFHGGGFSLPPNSGHLEFVVRCSKVLQDKGERAVIAFVEYGLTPENRYPTQYLQAVRALNYVLQKDYQPADLILGGDSAGGNICLAIMSLALHAANDTLSQPTLPSPLAGVFLICPWVSFQSSSSSYRDNAAIDIVLAPQMHHWAEAFLPVALAASQRLDDSVIHNLVEPVSAETAWWKGFPAQQVLMVGGDKEVFRDDIKELGKKLAGASVTTSTVICENQIHIECILDAQYGDTPGKMSVTIWDWLARLVS